MRGSDDRTVASERNTVKRFRIAGRQRIAGIMPFAALAGGRVEEKDAIREADGADVPKPRQQHVR
jgi:hypothetical protein